MNPPEAGAWNRGGTPPRGEMRPGSHNLDARSERKDENPEKPGKEVSDLLPLLAIRAMPREIQSSFAEE